MIVALADEFLQLLRQQQADALEDWLKKAMSNAFKPFQSFADGLREDYAAVKVGLTTTISNSQVEGFNNRLKKWK